MNGFLCVIAETYTGFLIDLALIYLPSQPKVACKVKTVEDIVEWIFPRDATDWVQEDTGELLTGYSMLGKLEYLLNERVNTTLS